MKIHSGAHLLEIQATQNEYPPLQWDVTKFYSNKSWSYCKIKRVIFIKKKKKKIKRVINNVSSIFLL